MTFTAGVPQTDSAIHLSITAGNNQSRKASTSISAADYWLIDAIQAEVLERNSANATIEFQVRTFGGAWKTKKILSASNNHIGETPPSWFFIVPPNSDVRLQARSDGASIAVAGNIFGRLATIL